MNYKEKQKAIAIKLISTHSILFNGDKAGRIFRKIPREFVLQDGINNLFEPIRNDVLKYFKGNKVAWWGGKKPTGHVLSSQIACLNHLFHVRNDKQSVLIILKNISNNFIDALPILSDKSHPAFVQFESVSDHDYLNEGTPTRGNNCTSIDALIYALHKDGSKWIIPIEWKYTEVYSNQNKALEGINIDPIQNKGKTRKARYSDLINASSQLKSDDHTCYYFEPFYQLMRQTIWAEQMIQNRENEIVKADNYLHVHVIPSENKPLLEKKYKCSNHNMESTWRMHLKDQSKYLIITPEILMSGLDMNKFQKMIEYLAARYWVD